MSRETPTLAVGREALVVFEDRRDASVLRCLRPGFRHCFCLTGGGTRWTLCDPLKGRLALAAADGLGVAELAGHFVAGGGRVLLGPVADGGAPDRRLGLRPLTCVEIVKASVGLRAASVLTPHQLYRRLLRGAAFVELAA